MHTLKGFLKPGPNRVKWFGDQYDVITFETTTGEKVFFFEVSYTGFF